MNSGLNIVFVSLKLIFLCNLIISVDEMDAIPLCGPNACQKIKCVPLELIHTDCATRKGIMEERGGWCSCCPVCLKRLYEDQNCSVTLNPQLPLRARCSEGLVCDVKTNRCAVIHNSIKLSVDS